MTSEPTSSGGIAEVLRSVDLFLQWVASAGPRGPEVAGKGRTFLDGAWSSPDSAWCRYYAFTAVTTTKNGAGWLMSPEVDAEIGERSVVVRRQARALVPSPELDAELAALQRQYAITPRTETQPAPSF